MAWGSMYIFISANGASYEKYKKGAVLSLDRPSEPLVC